ncbi:MAG: hypothetical protein IH963_00245 [Chloroflexi bacterium]|nr:hypothetical protein [Chloroflexota bacterium]
MIGVLTHHWAKPDKIEEAKTLLDGNGLAQSKAPGYGVRLTFISQEDSTKISTLVTWDSNEIYDAWRASPERAKAMDGANELWSKPAESERFQMAD